MAKCFEESHQAYSNGNGSLAKELSGKGKQHQKRMEELNKQASEWIFVGTCLFERANNVRTDLWNLENNKVRSCLSKFEFRLTFDVPSPG